MSFYFKNLLKTLAHEHFPNKYWRIKSRELQNIVFLIIFEDDRQQPFSRAKVNDRQPIGEGGGSRAAEPQKFLRIRGWLQTCRRVETAGAVKLLDGYLPRGRTCPRQFQTYFNIHISPVPSPRVRAPLNRRLRIPFAA